MQEDGIFDLLKKLPSLMDHFCTRRHPRLDREIYELNAMAAAGINLQPVASAIPLPSEVHNRFDAPASETSNLSGAGLGRTPNTGSDLMAVRINGAKDMMIDEKQRMIDIHLKKRGITDERVLDAFVTVPREEFVPKERRDSAYADHPLPIGYRQTISQPYIVALTIQALKIKNTDTVLELGAGSGYAAAIIAELAHKVITIERISELAEKASETLTRLGYTNVEVLTADGTAGYDEQAPYNGIAVAAAAPNIPPSLLDQLASGGRMVIPVGPEGFQQLLYIEKNDKGKVVEKRNICDCSFVPLIGKEGY